MSKLRTSGSRHTVPLTLLSLLAAVGFGLAVWLTEHFYELKNGTAAFRSICNLGNAANCDTIAASRFAELLPGLPLSSVAAGWFLAILGVSLLARLPEWRRDSLKIALALTGWGLLTSGVYFGIMAFALKTYCLFCIGIDVVNLLSFLIVLGLRKDWIPLLGGVRMDAGRLKTLAGITAGGLALGVIGLGLAFATPGGNIPVDELVQSVEQSPSLPLVIHPELPSFGPQNAPVTIVEFSDFQCPHCRRGAMIMHSLLKRYPTQLRVVFRNYHLDPRCNTKMKGGGHDAACEAARAAVCAHRQGEFESVYEHFFDSQESLKPGLALSFAKIRSQKPDLLNQCFESPEAQTRVAEDLNEGDRLGVQSTPTFFINGKKVEGAFPIPVWERLIEARLNSTPAPVQGSSHGAH